MVCRKLISRGLCMIFLEKTPPVSRICGMGHGLQKTAMISRGLCMIFFSKDTTSVTHLWHGPWFAENCHDITWPLHDFFSKDTTSVTHLLHGPWFALFFKRARLCLFLFLLRHSTCHMPCMFGFFTETCAEIMWPLHVGFSKDISTAIMYIGHGLQKADITWPLHDFFSKDTTSVTHLLHGPWFGENCPDITWPLHDFFGKDTTSFMYMGRGLLKIH